MAAADTFDWFGVTDPTVAYERFLRIFGFFTNNAPVEVPFHQIKMIDSRRWDRDRPDGWAKTYGGYYDILVAMLTVYGGDSHKAHTMASHVSSRWGIDQNPARSLLEMGQYLLGKSTETFRPTRYFEDMYKFFSNRQRGESFFVPESRDSFEMAMRNFRPRLATVEEQFNVREAITGLAGMTPRRRPLSQANR